MIGEWLAAAVAVVALLIGWRLSKRTFDQTEANAACMRELLGKAGHAVRHEVGSEADEVLSGVRLTGVTEFVHGLGHPVEAVRSPSPGITVFFVAGLAVAALGTLGVVDRIADRDEVRARCEARVAMGAAPGTPSPSVTTSTVAEAEPATTSSTPTTVESTTTSSTPTTVESTTTSSTPTTVESATSSSPTTVAASKENGGASPDC